MLQAIVGLGYHLAAEQHRHLPRAEPLTGAELLDQATRALGRSGLPEARYDVILGADAEPSLWDDGRVRGSNEHIIVDIVGLSGGDLGN